ncbi:MAG: hypothetical protein AB2A00_01975 [Myxococcota bacterium]
MLEMARGQDEQRRPPAGALSSEEDDLEERLERLELLLAFKEEYGGDGDDQC